MDGTEAYILKTILRTLQAVGGIGMTKNALMDQLDLAAGMPLTTSQREDAWALLVGRRYINSHIEPVINQTRWCITEKGADVMEAL